MSKAKIPKRSAASGRYVTGAIGTSKAEKFSAVEGMSLTRQNSGRFMTLKSNGLKGKALRHAITDTFKSAKRK